MLLSSFGKQFVLKLLSDVFTEKDLSISNVNGGVMRMLKGVVSKWVLKEEGSIMLSWHKQRWNFQGNTVG